jgi:hypothetical protein
MALALTSCSSNDTREFSEGEVVGTYVGKYLDGTETVEMLTNRTFKQTFVKNDTILYTNQGAWQLMPHNSIDLKPFIYLKKKLDKNNNLIGEPVQGPLMMAKWYRDPERIEFGEWPYFVRKHKQ